jgi:hypothetical protein
MLIDLITLARTQNQIGGNIRINCDLSTKMIFDLASLDGFRSIVSIKLALAGKNFCGRRVSGEKRCPRKSRGQFVSRKSHRGGILRFFRDDMVEFFKLLATPVNEIDRTAISRLIPMAANTWACCRSVAEM